MKVHVGGIALHTPQIEDWGAFAAIAAGQAQIGERVEPDRYQPQRLPRNERRRATDIVRLTFRLLEQLAEGAPVDPAATQSVFASSGGDYDVVHRISSALAEAEVHISPTDFHNSVHNAAAGYWGIATGCHEASTSLSAGDDTFPVGLLEAATLCLANGAPTLFVAYDIAPSPPLALARPIAAPFGVAMLLGAEPFRGGTGQLGLALPAEAATADSGAAVDWSGVARGNPITRCLPLLEGVWRGEGHFRFAGSVGLDVTVSGPAG